MTPPNDPDPAAAPDDRPKPPRLIPKLPRVETLPALVKSLSEIERQELPDLVVPSSGCASWRTAASRWRAATPSS